ncbi:unnamed protein product [Clonostachys solani]|uniref:Uncharacterized protein n=1 Tax=Clonostachys solani TaxID=160281 RepID=A0A9N9ZJ96_9HYPO|nr:unnamed protein product [Clonostachys solani]
MDSPQGSPNGTEPKSSSQTNNTSAKTTEHPALSQARAPPLEVKRMEQDSSSEPEFPEMPPSFNWDDFEKRYEEALREAGQAEQDIFKEAENLSKYFRTWAAAASSHDDERAVKRLQTRRRFVNISEEKMAQKQQHYSKDRTPLNHSNPTALELPAVTSDDFAAFFQEHFAEETVSQFGIEFLDSNEAHAFANPELLSGWEEEVEDDLGYYEDGVKRTLTDEQIEIFRHSELQELRRQRIKQENKGKGDPSPLRDDLAHHQAGSISQPSLSAASSRNKKKKKGINRQPAEPKPDLRKRTWDVVEKGLDSLDYD